MRDTKPATTHFGYREVAVKEKTSLVHEVFSSVAGKYDLMNDLMSLGIHRLWKRDLVANSGIRLGQSVLDLAGGTGDISALLSKRVGARGRVVLTDINADMLELGRRRLEDRGISGNVEYALVNAEQLPFADSEFDAVTIAFGLRNVTDKDAALREMFRVLRPGGARPDPRVFHFTSRRTEKGL
jgi:demethylmenaquinone methyltransferase/2-methoxy-6-polyprenyl-1,4-benzoquinol methylase